MSLFYDSSFTIVYDMELFTDASLVGFGAYFQNQWFCSEWPDCLLSIQESDLSMAFRELYPIVAAAVVWGRYWTSKRIMFISDNEATVHIIRKMRSKCLPIMKLVRTLTWTAAVNNFHFSSKHLPGRLNTVADHLSILALPKLRDCAPQADKNPQTCPSPDEIIWGPFSHNILLPSFIFGQFHFIFIQIIISISSNLRQQLRLNLLLHFQATCSLTG